MINRTNTVATLALLATTSLATAGNIVWDNGDFPTTPGPGADYLLAFSYTNESPDQTTGDDFMLSAATAITTVHWTGAYENGFKLPSVTPAFLIEFYADDNPATVGPTGSIADPSTLALASYLFAPGSVSQVDEDTWLPDSNIFDYSATLNTPFVAQAGVHYWMTIQIVDEGDLDLGVNWGWGMSGTQQLDTLATHVDPEWVAWIEFDLIFSLEGHTVPAPGALALLGFGALLSRRRRA